MPQTGRAGAMVVRWRWLILAVAAAVLAIGASWGTGVFADLVSGGFDDPASQSSRARQRAVDLLGRQDIDVAVMYSAPGGDPLPAAQAIAQRLREHPKVASIHIGPPSSNGHSVYLALRFHSTREDARLDDLALLRPLLRADPPLTTEIGGPIGFLDDGQRQVSQDITKAEMVSLPILLVLLIVMFRGLVAALTPLLVGVLAVLGALTAVRLLTHLTEVSVFAINIITMLGLGMAIDYSLFIVSRFREELAAGRSTQDSVHATLATAGRTVLVSGLTVMLALASLLVYPMGFQKGLAWGGMSAVAIATLAALTVLPALLAVLGRRVDSLPLRLPAFVPRRAPHHGVRREGIWERIALRVMRRPILFAVGVSAILLTLAAPFLRVQLGMLDERLLPEGTESRTVMQRMSNDFPRSGYPISVLIVGASHDLPERIRALPSATEIAVTAQRGEAVLLSVGYEGDPMGHAARDLVRKIRKLPTPPGTEVMVGGRPAIGLDDIDAFAKRLPWMLLAIASTTFLLLLIAFRSVVLPLKAIVMNVVSIGASFGVVVWVFQDGHLARWLGFTPTGYLQPAILVLMLAVLFGLATDYEVFLLSRMREQWRTTGDNRSAVASGLQRTSGIITAAACLLMVVVAGFATGQTTTIKLLGVGMVVAIATDAFLVRILLVPATMRLLGKWNWWMPGSGKAREPTAAPSPAVLAIDSR